MDLLLGPVGFCKLDDWKDGIAPFIPGGGPCPPGGPWPLCGSSSDDNLLFVFLFRSLFSASVAPFWAF